MIKDSIVDAVAREFLSKLPIEKGKTTDTLKLNGAFLTKYGTNLYGHLMSQAPDLYAKHVVDYGPESGSLHAPAFSMALRGKILQIIKDEKDKLIAVDLSSTQLNDSIDAPLADITIIYNVECEKRSIIYDKKNDIHYEYDFDFAVKELKKILGDNSEQYLDEHSERCLLKYIPGVDRIVFHTERGKKHKIFNLWSEAEWRNDWDKSKEDIHPLLNKFLISLVPGMGDRGQFLAWLRDATFSRAEPVLILCGEPGTGKNIAIQHLAAALVGVQNYRGASRGFGKTGFHSSIRNCRLFFMDEMELTSKLRDDLKSFHNGEAAIELKGIDVNSPERISASFVLANNFKKYIKLEYTDRKFFVPQISKIPLTDLMTKAEINELVGLIKTDKEFIQNFATYLFNNFKEGESENFTKNELFYDLCIQSYNWNFQRFISNCKNRDRFTSRVFDKRKTIDAYDLRASVAHYETTFKQPLAILTINDEDGSWTATSQICIKQTAKDNESEEGAIL